MPLRLLSNDERRDWLRLSRTENVGAITFRALIRRFGSAKAAIEALPQMAARGGKKSFRIPANDIIDRNSARPRIGERLPRPEKLGISLLPVTAVTAMIARNAQSTVNAYCPR